MGFVRHNRIEVFEDKRYQYDAHGRVIEKRIGHHTTIHFKWNSEHQLTEAITERHGARQYTRYEYDALGRRIGKRDDFGATEFLWDGMRLLQESRNHRITTYIYQPGSHEPIARVDRDDETLSLPGKPARIYHFHNHINGAPEEMTNEAGEIVWQGRYRTWGNLALQQAAKALQPEPGRETVLSPQPLRMQGQYAEVETGLHYNTFRYYDPDIGRFISEDPIGLGGGANLYQFAPNTDGWIDPWGWAKSKCLFRGDERSPDEVFKTGFQPRGKETDLFKYALYNVPSAYVSTSTSVKIAQEFASGNGYVYTIRSQTKGIDVNATLGSNSPFAHEKEIAVLGGIRTEDIMGARKAENRGSKQIFSGPFIKNPNFQP
jgi:RHS repeat-associated protein